MGYKTHDDAESRAEWGEDYLNRLIDALICGARRAQQDPPARPGFDCESSVGIESDTREAMIRVVTEQLRRDFPGRAGAEFTTALRIAVESAIALAGGVSRIRR